jgi:hypothetical protein
MKRDDILSKKAQIKQWILERRSKAYICMQLSCKPETLETYLRKLGITYEGNKGGQGYPRTDYQKPAAAYLYKGSTVSTNRLKLKLIQDGLKLAICESCRLQTWLDQKIPLELHHLNGDRYDNRLENLRILCPNCHALTENHAGKGIGRKPSLSQSEMLQLISNEDANHHPVTVLVFDSSDHYAAWQKTQPGLQTLIEHGHQLSPQVNRRKACLFCNKQLSTPAQDTYCSIECFRLASRKTVRPSKEELEQLVWEAPTSQLAKQFGVTDTAIAKWCRAYGITKPPRGYWAKLNSQ